MQGKIIKGIAGFYYVNIEGKGIFECKAKGAFRNNKIKPLVGDDVEIDIIDEEKFLGNIMDIHERSSEIIRPACANVEQALVIFSIKTPDPNYNLLDRFLIYMDSSELDTIICFNKDDLATDKEAEDIRVIYEKSGYELIFLSARNGEGFEKLYERLKGRTTVVAGPSGVGKSSIINRLLNGSVMQTGAISLKTERGKHTTRHSELLYISEGTYIMDTPGFTSLDVFGAEEDTLKFYYKEFEEYGESCRFRTCVHINEPDCGVKKALEAGLISPVRYDNYVKIYEELKGQRKW